MGDGMTEIDVKCKDCDRPLKHICSESSADFYRGIDFICHICASKIPLAPRGEIVRLKDVMREVVQSDEKVVFGR